MLINLQVQFNGTTVEKSATTSDHSIVLANQLMARGRFSWTLHISSSASDVTGLFVVLNQLLCIFSPLYLSESQISCSFINGQ